MHSTPTYTVYPISPPAWPGAPVLPSGPRSVGRPSCGCGQRGQDGLGRPHGSLLPSAQLSPSATSSLQKAPRLAHRLAPTTLFQHQCSLPSPHFCFCSVYGVHAHEREHRAPGLVMTSMEWSGGSWFQKLTCCVFDFDLMLTRWLL